MARKYARSASENVERVMEKRKAGTLRSGAGQKVKSRKQAIAIALSESRRAGKKVPEAPSKSAKNAGKTVIRKTGAGKIATRKKAASKKGPRTAKSVS